MKLKPCSAVLCASALSALSPARAEPFDYHSVRGRETRGPEAGLLEGEHLPMHGTSKVQGMRNYGVGWSGDAHLLWEGEVGESMKTTLSIQNEGRYRLAVRLTKAPDYGVFSSFLDGTKLREGIDLYDPRVALDKEIDLGVVDLKAGSHDLVFKLTGANPKAKKFKGKLQLMGLDYLKLVNLAPTQHVVTQKQKLVPKT